MRSPLRRGRSAGPVFSLPAAALLALTACGGAARPAARSAGDCAGAPCPASDRGETQASPAADAELVSRFPATGSIAVTLHPGPQAVIGRPTVVSFGAPFPPGVLSSAEELGASDGRGALPTKAAAIATWRVWPGRADGRESVRAALVSVEVTFAQREPLAITLRYGARGAARLPEAPAPTADWVEVTDGEYPAGTVREPRVYATFSPDWLGRCLLRTRTTPAGRDEAWGWFDRALVEYARTAVNDVPAEVVQRLDYATSHEPWLFDRTATLYGVYFRTGDVAWLRHAHRSAQFYLGRLTPEGTFDLKKQPDLKYGYGRSLFMDYQLTGDPVLLGAIDRIAAHATAWRPAYQATTGFWTERHQAYALLAALSAWEASGDEQSAARAKEIAELSFGMAERPAGPWRPEGCMLHTMNAHEGAGGDQPICSPWMSALFADVVWEYYIHSRDRAALRFLAGLGRFVAEQGLYPGEGRIPRRVPWYLASSAKKFTEDGPFADVEHTCDVAGLAARAAWAARELGDDPAPLRATAAELLEGCRWNLDAWHRPNGPASGKSEWRLAPGRKFNWWFGTTSDLPWLMAATESRRAPQ